MPLERAAAVLRLAGGSLEPAITKSGKSGEMEKGPRMKRNGRRKTAAITAGIRSAGISGAAAKPFLIGELLAERKYTARHLRPARLWICR